MIIEILYLIIKLNFFSFVSLNSSLSLQNIYDFFNLDIGFEYEINMYLNTESEFFDLDLISYNKEDLLLYSSGLQNTNQLSKGSFVMSYVSMFNEFQFGKFTDFYSVTENVYNNILYNDLISLDTMSGMASNSYFNDLFVLEYKLVSCPDKYLASNGLVYDYSFLNNFVIKFYLRSGIYDISNQTLNNDNSLFITNINPLLDYVKITYDWGNGVSFDKFMLVGDVAFNNEFIQYGYDYAFYGWERVSGNVNYGGIINENSLDTTFRAIWQPNFYDFGDLVDDAYRRGFDAGKLDALTLSSDFSTNWFVSILNGVSSILTIEILPHFKLGYILSVPIIFGLFYWLIGMLKGGER